MDEDLSYDIRIDPITNKPVRGRFIWTPLPGESFLDDEELVYTPVATEYMPKDVILREKYSDFKEVEKSINPINREISQITRPSIKAAAALYKGECICGCTKDIICPEKDNCAHFLSNAFIKAGYTELLTSPLISFRCKWGGNRPVRAFDMLKWFQLMRRRYNGKFHRGRVKPNTGFWATYQEKPGWKHVVILDSNGGFYGTMDGDDWPLQWNYQW